MEQEKYYLELSGTLIDGHEPEAVEAALAKLLRLPPEQVRPMLQGTPSRIRKQLDQARAEKLLRKVVACGAGALVVPVSRAHRPRKLPVIPSMLE